MKKTVALSAAAWLALAVVAGAQQQARRPLSPRGTASTQIGGKYVKTERGDRYEGGKWIDIEYGRPILRGRTTIFGSGAEFGKTLNAGAPVWRVGADQSTRLKTEVPLEVGGKAVPAGEYSLFVDLTEKEWTLIVSTHARQENFDPNDKTALWGSFGYTPDKDVARLLMKVEKIPFLVDQLTIGFIDVTADGGKIAVWWANYMATAPFKVASGT